MRYALEQFQKFGEAVVGHTALAAVVVVVSWDVFAERDATVGTVLQEVNDFPAKLCKLLVHERAHAETTKLWTDKNRMVNVISQQVNFRPAKSW